MTGADVAGRNRPTPAGPDLCRIHLGIFQPVVGRPRFSPHPPLCPLVACTHSAGSMHLCIFMHKIASSGTYPRGKNPQSWSRYAYICINLTAGSAPGAPLAPARLALQALFKALFARTPEHPGPKGHLSGERPLRGSPRLRGCPWGSPRLPRSTQWPACSSRASAHPGPPWSHNGRARASSAHTGPARCRARAVPATPQRTFPPSSR